MTTKNTYIPDTHPTTPYNARVVGRCSLCGGLVTVPELWWGITPPPKTCNNCGAIAQDHFYENLPIIPMEPKVPYPNTPATWEYTKSPKVPWHEPTWNTPSWGESKYQWRNNTITCGMTR